MEKDWITLTYTKQADSTYACELTSTIPLERGKSFEDMKVYLESNSERKGTRRSSKRVYEQFTASVGDTIHIDVYANDGESTGIAIDFEVSEQAIEIDGESSDDGGILVQVVNGEGS